MNLQILELGNNINKIALAGRLDAPGVDQVETRFTAAAVSSRKNAIVDLSSITFIASMGIRMLIATARAMRLKNTKMVLYGAQDLVQEVLDTVALSEIIPVASDETQALSLLRA